MDGDFTTQQARGQLCLSVAMCPVSVLCAVMFVVKSTWTPVEEMGDSVLECASSFSTEVHIGKKLTSWTPPPPLRPRVLQCPPNRTN